MTYRKLLVERWAEGDKPAFRVIEGSAGVTSDKTIERKVILWVDPKRKTLFKFITPLIDILQNEIPKLGMMRRLFDDLRDDLFKLGFPIKLEFNIKRNIWITMKIRSSDVVSSHDCPESLFRISPYSRLTPGAMLKPRSHSSPAPCQRRAGSIP